MTEIIKIFFLFVSQINLIYCYRQTKHLQYKMYDDTDIYENEEQ